MVALPLDGFVIVFLVQTIGKIVHSQDRQIAIQRCRNLCCSFRIQITHTHTTTSDYDLVIQQTVVGISSSDPSYGSINQLPTIAVSK